MCGIAGLIRRPGGRLHPKMIALMASAVQHRGPDGEGYLLISDDAEHVIPFGGRDTLDHVYGSGLSYHPSKKQASTVFEVPENRIFVLLGHRRLAIVDSSARGHQPMCLSGRSLWITYNGEIFNYLEIRHELEIAGYAFHTKTDTEVLLAAYDYWGFQCLHKFNGMFAFLIIDVDKNVFFAARDRFGVKPLYFWESPQGFLAFASEIKQFTILPGWHAKVEISSAINYLSFGITDFSEKTFFQDVFQLRGGEYIECSLDVNRMPAPKKWYHLKKEPLALSYSEATTKFLTLFQDAVDLRLRTDVATGSCLSGGLDSSAIVCMAHRLLNEAAIQGQQKTFSACSHVHRFDEKKYIEEIVGRTGVEAHFVTPSVDRLLSDLEKIIWHQDEPFGSTSIYAQYLVFESAKKVGVKVMLDGQGSDENLAGYAPFWMAHFAQLFKDFRWWSLFHEVRISKNWTLMELSKGILKQLLPISVKNLLKKNLSKTPRSSGLWINFDRFSGHSFYAFNEYKEIDHLVDRMAFDQLSNTSLPALLRYEDRDSMAHSIEARTPFLDFRLVEFIYNLPPHFRISRGHTKRIMREALKGILPEKVRLRTDKLGFATAEEVWMCEERSEWFKTAIKQAIDQSQGLLNEHVLHLSEAMLSKRIPFDWTLWRIINLGKWVDVFNVSVEQ